MKVRAQDGERLQYRGTWIDDKAAGYEFPVSRALRDHVRCGRLLELSQPPPPPSAKKVAAAAAKEK